MLGAIGTPSVPQEVSPVKLNQATRMANAAQTLWDALRNCDPADLEKIMFMEPELGAALIAVRKVMVE